MTREEETLAIVVFGLLLWDALKDPARRAEAALERGGARVYDLTHFDSEHKRDLPRPERMLSARRDKVRQWASSAGFQGDALELAVAVALAESGGRPDTINITAVPGAGPPGYRGREHSVGLFRINVLAHPRYTEAFLLDPMNNARAAYEISKAGTDWSAWSTFTNGSYRKYMQ